MIRGQPRTCHFLAPALTVAVLTAAQQPLYDKVESAEEQKERRRANALFAPAAIVELAD